jgi:purine-binding chemotaxis protein CheW
MFRDGTARLLVFRVGAELFGVDIKAVDEVVDAPPVQRLPDAPFTVLGIASLRGNLVTIYDPRPMLDVGLGTVGAVVVFTRGDRRIGLAVDDVYDATNVDEAALSRAPGSGDGLLVGVVRQGSQLIAVLDVDALLAAAVAEPEGEPK